MLPLVAGALTGLASAGAQVASQGMANATNIELAKQQRDFAQSQWLQAADYNTNMSNTAYQRAVKDMEAAGINPMVAFQQGGASTPTTSPQSSSPARVDSLAIGDAIRSGLSSALDAAKFEKELQQRDADIMKTTLDAQASRAAADLDKERSQAVARENLYATPESERETRLAELRLRKKTAEWDDFFSNTDAILKRLSSGLGAASSAKDLVNPLKTFGGRGVKGMSMPDLDKLLRKHYQWRQGK